MRQVSQDIHTKRMIVRLVDDDDDNHYYQYLYIAKILAYIKVFLLSCAHLFVHYNAGDGTYIDAHTYTNIHHMYGVYSTRHQVKNIFIYILMRCYNLFIDKLSSLLAA